MRFCFKEFKYLSDDEILKNFLYNAFPNKIEYDDYGRFPSKFYFIRKSYKLWNFKNT